MTAASNGPKLVDLLKALLNAVDTGDLVADTPQARRLVLRLEGAVAALETEQTSRQ